MLGVGPRSPMTSRRFWDARPDAIAAGIGSAGKFERYFACFAIASCRLSTSRRRVLDLLTPRDRAGRERFYEQRVEYVALAAAVSRVLLAHGHGPAGSRPRVLSLCHRGRRLAHSRPHASCDDRAGSCGQSVPPLDSDRNHGAALPLYPSRRSTSTRSAAISTGSNGDASRSRSSSARRHQARIDRYNLSDLFEYVSMDHYHRLLETLAAGRPPARATGVLEHAGAAESPAVHGATLAPLTSSRTRLHLADKAFFYSAFVVEEVI